MRWRARGVTPRPAHTESIGGLRIEPRNNGALVRTTDRVQLERALRVGFADADESPGVAVTTTVTAVAERASGREDGRALVVYQTRSGGEFMDEGSLIVALPEDEGYALFIAHERFIRQDTGDEDAIDSVTLSDLGPYVRLDAAGGTSFNRAVFDDGANGANCQGDGTAAWTFGITLVCRTSSPTACIQLGVESSRTNSTTDSDIECSDADGHTVAAPSSGHHHDTDPDWTLDVTAAPDGALTLRTTLGAAPDTLSALLGTHTFDELVSVAAADATLMAHTDRVQAAARSAAGE